ncbi:TetR/AcrR family transcriptional regulator [Lactobacillaceae bacterium Scapto_B20]
MHKTKDNIALAYLSLVETYSILNVSNDAIIQESGVSRGTFYNHFSSQRDILNYVQRQIDHQLITPIQRRLAALANQPMNLDGLITVVSEVLMPMMYQQVDLFGLLYRCNLDHLWTRPLLRVFDYFINPTLDDDIERDSKILTSYMLLILESWIAIPMPTKPTLFKVEFRQLLQQPATGLLKKE